MCVNRTSSAISLTVALFLLLVSGSNLYAQKADSSVNQLDEVVVQGYINRQPLRQVPASLVVVDQKLFLNTSQQSLLPALNTVPGVRMEERSPGSYRLSIRGSLLRSPFGIRNVKIYMDDMPFTDASGNAYVNVIDPVFIQRAEILKGSDGSLFGANSGGVVLFNTRSAADSSSVDGGVSGGSFGLMKQHIRIGHSGKRLQWNIGQAFQRADGYREHSAMKRLNVLANGRLLYGSDNILKITMLYADMHYQTPGGLTRAQYNDDPTRARPAAGMAAGAVQQQAGIYNQTFFGGISNEWKISRSFRHVIHAFTTVTDFKNPFITNYELRDERNAGLRSFMEYSIQRENVNLNWHTGAEAQWGNQQFENYENLGGVKGTWRQSDTIAIQQQFYFSRVQALIGKRLTAEIAASINRQQYTINGIARNLTNQWMPRVAMSYRLTEPLILRASISKGYSPPTVGEIRPSGAVVNKMLQAEWGWSYEAGIRFQGWAGRVQLDASVFRYNMNDAITRRTTEDDTEYFVNAGGTKQTGVESSVFTTLMPQRKTGFIRHITVQSSYAYSRFVFDQYQNDGNDYSGNRLTGVPRHNVTMAFNTEFPKSVYFYAQLLAVSRIPLNDGNTEYADAYQLLQARIAWKGLHVGVLRTEFFVGTDNLLNQTYSLGNDINAFGGRYYNAAPAFNVYGGLAITYRQPLFPHP